jgi:hypothetical protein
MARKNPFATALAPGLVIAALAVPAQAPAATLESSTYLGHSALDIGKDVAVDSAGSIYVLSYTESKSFPTTPGAFDRRVDRGDAAISKFDASGSELLWSTFLGGSGFECSPECSLAVDSAGAVYVAGATDSPDFPTTAGAYDSTHNGGEDVFVAKLDPSGGLAWSTYLGGPQHDIGFEIVVDGSGAVYVAGGADPGFPATAGAFDDTHNGETDAFVAKLDPTGARLVYSTYLGGSGEDDAFGGLAVDAGGAAYVGGETQSTDFPATVAAFDPALNGRSDAFAAKLHPSGSSLAYGTFLGGESFDYALDLQVDASGDAFIVGDTRSGGFPVTPAAFDTTYAAGDSDGFVAKLDGGGGALDYGTYLGGSGGERAAGVAVADDGSAFVTGSTGSAEFPVTAGAFDSTLDGGGDAFVTALDATGSGVVDSGFLGGSQAEHGAAIALDGTGAIHVTGSTTSADFPTTPGAFDTRGHNSNRKNATFDAFVAKLRR